MWEKLSMIRTMTRPFFSSTLTVHQSVKLSLPHSNPLKKLLFSFVSVVSREAIFAPVKEKESSKINARSKESFFFPSDTHGGN